MQKTGKIAPIPARFGRFSPAFRHYCVQARTSSGITNITTT